MPQASPVMVRALFVVAYGVFTLWTVRRLLGVSATGRGSNLIARGVTGFGLPFWAAMTVLWTLRDPDAFGPVWLTAALIAFVMFPLSLWAGYSWGSLMGLFFGGSGDR